MSIIEQNLINEKENLKGLLSNFHNQLVAGISDAEMVAYKESIINSISNYRTWYYEIYNDDGSLRSNKED